jgi:hypothetical protein
VSDVDLVDFLDDLPTSHTGKMRGEDKLNGAITAALQHSAHPETAEIARAIVSATRRKAIPPALARDVLARILPPLGTASIVPTITLHDAEEPLTPAAYRKTLRTIWRAAVKEGRIGLDEARKAMILTKTLWRAELETAGLGDHTRA